MQHKINKNYETFVENNKLVFRITEGQFKDVEYVYSSMKLNGDIKYKIKSKKNLINESNKMLFEDTLRHIIKDKLNQI